MNNRKKRLLLSCAIGFSVFALTGCTKSFCAVQDKAEQLAVYEEKNIKSINEKAEKRDIILPQLAFIQFIDTKVESYVQVQENCPKDEKGNPLSSFARYAGFNAKGKQELWVNYDKWYSEAQIELGLDNVPSRSYINFYKTSLQQGIAGKTACITPVDGDFGLPGNEVFLSGKSWGEAFRDYGPLEGLFVYPISCMIHYFTNFFGTAGWGQIWAIFLVTIIIRAVMLLITFPSVLSQSKMSSIQPEVNALQQKYPNSATNSYDKSMLAREQMSIYKKHHIHPFLQIVFMFIQLPVFLCVWSALQGSAILTQGTVFSLELTRLTSSAIMSFSGETPFALILFLMMSLSQVFSTLLPQFIQKFKEKKLASTVKVQPNQQQKSMKMVSYFMMGMIIVMGLTLPAAMGVYWFVGAIFSISQTIIIEFILSHKRKKTSGPTGGGQNWNKNKKQQKAKSFSVRKK